MCYANIFEYLCLLQVWEHEIHPELESVSQEDLCKFSFVTSR